MTHAELVREARAIVPPVGADKAIALVDDQGHYRAAFLINGLKRSAPVGPSFDKPRAVCAFVDLLNGDDRPASRSGSDDFAGAGALTSGDARVQPEAPDEAPGVDAVGARTVVPLSGPSTGPSPAEVLAAHVQDVIRACNPLPTSSEASSGESPLLLGASRDAGPELHPTGQRPAVPTLGF